MIAVPLMLATLNQATTSPDIEPVRKASAMLLLVVIVLGVLLLALLLMIVSKRTRRRQAAAAALAAKSPAPMGDPWAEAARRVQPFDSRDTD